MRRIRNTCGCCNCSQREKYYSDLDGKFIIPDVKAGKYALQVELISYEPVSMEVELTTNQELQISLQQK